MASLGLFPQNSTIPHSARIQVLSRTLEQQVFMTQLHLLLLCLQKQNSSEWLCRHSLSDLRVSLMVTLGKHFPLHPFWSKEALWCMLGLGTRFLIKLHICPIFLLTTMVLQPQCYPALKLSLLNKISSLFYYFWIQLQSGSLNMGRMRHDFLN